MHSQKIAVTVTLPKPTCTYADHSYPAYTEKQVRELLENLGFFVRTSSELALEEEK
jgi:hypothetical protein